MSTCLVVSGLMLVTAGSFRSEFLLLPPFVALRYVTIDRPMPEVARHALLTMTPVVLSLLPWSVRNYGNLDQAIPFNSGLCLAMWQLSRERSVVTVRCAPPAVCSAVSRKTSPISGLRMYFGALRAPP